MQTPQFPSFPEDAYLKRVKLKTAPELNANGLENLHNAQYYSIPFENLDIRLGKGISLDPGHIASKLLKSRRGGYCFELNGLMLRALNHFGFKARPLLARVHLEPTPSGKTHQVSLVELDGKKWIVDVGFGGGGPRYPMLLKDGWERVEDFWGYRIAKDTNWGFMLQSLEKDSWQNSYGFTMARVRDADIEVGNHYTSTSPNTHFTQTKVASLPTSTGRISLRDREFTELDQGKSKTSTIESSKDYLQLLSSRFGIEIDN